MQLLSEVMEDVRSGRRPPWPCHPDPRKFRPSEPPARLSPVADFGSNPGNLRMLTYSPRTLRRKPPLVAVLHGCGQSASDIACRAGWIKLARDFGFALLAPEQSRANNPQRGFNWFLPADATRDLGECLSIRQMIDWMIEEQGVDCRRIYIAGLSAGAAMSQVMLATYPEVFAGGAIIAGLPYGVATNVVDAIGLMKGTVHRSPRQLGDLVRAASPHWGARPKVSIWQGDADRVVAATNANAIARQWLDVLDLPEEAAKETLVCGHTRRFWRDASGRTVLESFVIPKLGHAVPLDAFGRNGPVYGARAPFFKDAGISSTFQIARFWGLSSPRAF